MATIPQYTRESLVSPLVGTPGVDTSGQQIGESLAKAGESLASTAFDMAIKRQQSKDESEADNLMTQYKIATINTYEQHKQTYASNPDASGPVFHQAMHDNLQAVASQASNDRVKFMVQKGDPHFDGHMVLDHGRWASTQEQNNMVAQAKSTIDDLGHKAQTLGENEDLTIEQKQEQMKTLASALGNTVNSLKAGKRPDLAEEAGTKGLQSIARGVFGGTLNSNPAQALAMLDTPQFKELFNEKQLGEMAKGADAGMKSFAAKQNWKTVSKDLVEHPTIVNDILAGKTTWMDVDNMQKQDVGVDTPVRQQTWDYLKKLSLSTSPNESGAEQAEVHDKLLTDAHNINVAVPKKTPTNNVNALMKFSNELIDAKVRGAISPSEFNQLHKSVVSPLTAAVIKKFDPQGFDATPIGKWWHDIWGGQKAPQEVVNRFSQGFDTIDNYLKVSGADKKSNYHENKRALMTQYLAVVDGKLGNPNARTPQGSLYTPVDVAHEVMGIQMGYVHDFGPFGKRVISGYDGQGNPTFTSTKEDDDMLANQKALKALQKKK